MKFIIILLTLLISGVGISSTYGLNFQEEFQVRKIEKFHLLPTNWLELYGRFGLDQRMIAGEYEITPKRAQKKKQFLDNLRSRLSGFTGLSKY